MDTSVAARPGIDERAILLQLTGIQARRYATHPLFLVGLALLLLTGVVVGKGAAGDPWWFESTTFGPAFFLGVLGIVVGYRLTTTEDRAVDLLPSAPTRATTRTLALLGACLVPAATALVVLLALVVLAAVATQGSALPHPAPGLVEATGGWATWAPALLDGTVIACFGGPALGVAAGRWWRFPGAGVLVAVAVALASFVLAGTSLQIPGAGESWWIRVTATAAPWADYVVVTEVGDVAGVRPGSRLGHLLYAACLCGLAAWAAVMRDAEGDRRGHWTRIGTGLAVLAVLAYVWALLG